MKRLLERISTRSLLWRDNNYEWPTTFLDNLEGTKILLLAEQIYRCGNAVVVVERRGVAIIWGGAVTMKNVTCTCELMAKCGKFSG